LDYTGGEKQREAGKGSEKQQGAAKPKGYQLSAAHSAASRQLLTCDL
jgi:hypothetical protein